MSDLNRGPGVELKDPCPDGRALLGQGSCSSAAIAMSSAVMTRELKQECQFLNAALLSKKAPLAEFDALSEADPQLLHAKYVPRLGGSGALDTCPRNEQVRVEAEPTPSAESASPALPASMWQSQAAGFGLAGVGMQGSRDVIPDLTTTTTTITSHLTSARVSEQFVSSLNSMSRTPVSGHLHKESPETNPPSCSFFKPTSEPSAKQLCAADSTAHSYVQGYVAATNSVVLPSGTPHHAFHLQEIIIHTSGTGGLVSPTCHSSRLVSDHRLRASSPIPATFIVEALVPAKDDSFNSGQSDWESASDEMTTPPGDLDPADSEICQHQHFQLNPEDTDQSQPVCGHNTGVQSSPTGCLHESLFGQNGQDKVSCTHSELVYSGHVESAPSTAPSTHHRSEMGWESQGEEKFFFDASVIHLVKDPSITVVHDDQDQHSLSAHQFFDTPSSPNMSKESKLASPTRHRQEKTADRVCPEEPHRQHVPTSGVDSVAKLTDQNSPHFLHTTCLLGDIDAMQPTLTTEISSPGRTDIPSQSVSHAEVIVHRDAHPDGYVPHESLPDGQWGSTGGRESPTELAPPPESLDLPSLAGGNARSLQESLEGRDACQGQAFQASTVEPAVQWLQQQQNLDQQVAVQSIHACSLQQQQQQLQKQAKNQQLQHTKEAIEKQKLQTQQLEQRYQQMQLEQDQESQLQQANMQETHKAEPQELMYTHPCVMQPVQQLAPQLAPQLALQLVPQRAPQLAPHLAFLSMGNVTAEMCFNQVEQRGREHTVEIPKPAPIRPNACVSSLPATGIMQASSGVPTQAGPEIRAPKLQLQQEKGNELLQNLQLGGVPLVVDLRSIPARPQPYVSPEWIVESVAPAAGDATQAEHGVGAQNPKPQMQQGMHKLQQLHAPKVVQQSVQQQRPQQQAHQHVGSWGKATAEGLTNLSPNEVLQEKPVYTLPSQSVRTMPQPAVKNVGAVGGSLLHAGSGLKAQEMQLKEKQDTTKQAFQQPRQVQQQLLQQPQQLAPEQQKQAQPAEPKSTKQVMQQPVKQPAPQSAQSQQVGTWEEQTAAGNYDQGEPLVKQSSTRRLDAGDVNMGLAAANSALIGAGQQRAGTAPRGMAMQDGRGQHSGVSGRGLQAVQPMALNLAAQQLETRGASNFGRASQGNQQPVGANVNCFNQFGRGGQILPAAVSSNNQQAPQSNPNPGRMQWGAALPQQAGTGSHARRAGQQGSNASGGYGVQRGGEHLGNRGPSQAELAAEAAEVAARELRGVGRGHGPNTGRNRHWP